MHLGKRKFLLLSSIAFGASGFVSSPAHSNPVSEVVDGDVTFRWRRQDGRLQGWLSAPTDGWIAVGFNTVPGIAGTYFLMASVAGERQKIEEHYAIAPQHVPIAELGWSKTVQMRDSNFQDGVSSVAFSIAERPPEKERITLTQGADVHLMLAWSREADFDHHSAWRKHFQITL